MTDAETLQANINASLKSIARIIDVSFKNAPSQAARSQNDAEETICGLTLQLKGQNQHVTLEFKGPNAAVIARPISAVLQKHVTTQRSGDGDSYRKIEAEGSEKKMETAATALVHFSETMKSPENQKRLQATFNFVYRLERAATCKIFVEFEQNGNNLVIAILKIITAERSALANTLTGKNGLIRKNVGEWKQSDFKTRHERGVEFQVVSKEGAKAIQEAGFAILRRTPAATHATSTADSPTIVTGPSPTNN